MTSHVNKDGWELVHPCMRDTMHAARDIFDKQVPKAKKRLKKLGKQNREIIKCLKPHRKKQKWNILRYKKYICITITKLTHTLNKKKKKCKHSLRKSKKKKSAISPSRRPWPRTQRPPPASALSLALFRIQESSRRIREFRRESGTPSGRRTHPAPSYPGIMPQDAAVTEW